MREIKDNQIELGKVIGYCPKCLVPITEIELNKHCTRCYQILREHNLASDPEKAVAKQTIKQQGLARHADKVENKVDRETNTGIVNGNSPGKKTVKAKKTGKYKVWSGF